MFKGVPTITGVHEARDPTNTDDAPAKFSDLLRIRWVRSSLILGAVLTIMGLIVLLLLKSFDVSNTGYIADAKAFVAKYGLAGIFLITVIAGTLIPMGSPALVVAAAILGVPKVPLIIVATSGFTVGMTTNYVLGYYLGRPFVEKKTTAEMLREMSRLWEKFGWILYVFFGIIPVLPVELLSLICGMVKARLSAFLVLTFVSRLIVFTILAYFGEQTGFWIGGS